MYLGYLSYHLVFPVQLQRFFDQKQLPPFVHPVKEFNCSLERFAQSNHSMKYVLAHQYLAVEA